MEVFIIKQAGIGKVATHVVCWEYFLFFLYATIGPNTSGMVKKSTNKLAFMGIKYSYSDKIH